jgi:hypothetical protein
MKPMWFDQMDDTRMLLTLCIREEELDDPAAWCAEFREYRRKAYEGPKTVAEAEAMMAQGSALADRINKKPSE